VAAALLSFEADTVSHEALVERIAEYRGSLRSDGPPAESLLDRAWRTLRMRRLVVREGGTYVILPTQRPLLEFYANSIRHLLPTETRPPVMHPAREPDADLPRLREWKSR